MRKIERLLLKLAVIQLIILFIVQGFIHETKFIHYINKITLYEGAVGSEEQPKLNVFNVSE